MFSWRLTLRHVGLCEQTAWRCLPAETLFVRGQRMFASFARHSSCRYISGGVCFCRLQESTLMRTRLSTDSGVPFLFKELVKVRDEVSFANVAFWDYVPLYFDVGALHVASGLWMSCAPIIISIYLAKLFKQSYVFKLSLYVKMSLCHQRLYFPLFFKHYGRKGNLNCSPNVTVW